jgi:hypothetical protein
MATVAFSSFPPTASVVPSPQRCCRRGHVDVPGCRFVERLCLGELLRRGRPRRVHAAALDQCPNGLVLCILAEQPLLKSSGQRSAHMRLTDATMSCGSLAISAAVKSSARAMPDDASKAAAVMIGRSIRIAPNEVWRCPSGSARMRQPNRGTPLMRRKSMEPQTKLLHRIIPSGRTCPAMPRRPLGLYSRRESLTRTATVLTMRAPSAHLQCPACGAQASCDCGAPYVRAILWRRSEWRPK